MEILDVKFKNKNGDLLTGFLDLPTTQNAHNYVLFAHCFTCNKNFLAVRNISRALTSKGFGVLRFDFTGLGESEGDFADSNFSGNVEDLLSAALFLEENYEAPTLLIGHSLGGAAVIFAANELAYVQAIATIGTPADLTHVTHLIKDDITKINSQGSARVNIGGRSFNIKKQFLDDLETRELSSVLSKLNKSILILHSPQDSTVEIKNAEKLYVAAKHPKSFISLDGADHLLSRRVDSTYVGELIGSWAVRYIPIPEAFTLKSDFKVLASLGEEGFTTNIKAGRHNLIADEPLSFGGNDFGPTPYDFLSAGLASCTSMTIQMYARRKKWHVGTVETHVEHSKSHAIDCEECERSSAKIDTFNRRISITGDLDETQMARLLQIADKCPVHKTLDDKVQINTVMDNR